LGRITKRGDGYVRTVLIHGARSVVRLAGSKTDALSMWINRLVERCGFNKAVVALANKLAHIACVIIAQGERYQPYQVRRCGA
jgi:transposase